MRNSDRAGITEYIPIRVLSFRRAIGHHIRIRRRIFGKPVSQEHGLLLIEGNSTRCLGR